VKRFGSATGAAIARRQGVGLDREPSAGILIPYKLFSRYGEKPGTNPRNCFFPYLGRLMPHVSHVVRRLSHGELRAEQVDSKSEVVIDKDGDGFSITSVHITVTAKIPGIDQCAFQSIAAKCKGRLP